MSLSRPLAAASLTAFLAALPASAATVRFDTTFGAFDVDLFEEEAPGHVANFLAYVDAGDYDNNVIHRAAELQDGSDFVVQAGAFRFDGNPVSNPLDLPGVTNRGSITNEPGISNTRGTLALARVGGQENSGSNQFFFNLQDNSGLDNVDGGFTVFGEVQGDDGLAILDRIGDVPIFRGPAPFGELPLIDPVFEDDGFTSLGGDEFVLIDSIVRVAIDEPIDPVDPTDPTDPTDPVEPVDPAPADPDPVPTPGAAAAGLLGLAAVALRRRSVPGGPRVPGAPIR